MMSCLESKLALATMALALAIPASAQSDEAAELAKKLSNPVASLISVPLQYNHDEYGGANNGASANRLVVQPVVPFSLNNDWNAYAAFPNSTLIFVLVSCRTN